ncbi:hypothetical protein FZEAL_8684 [Fusarium zealandicum]|uniref:Uncharacterized protein n=1 Tax=Fusarium zealandicum TaxID=1053134 RepID=A0A8H4XH90_9HYPO|nr:hypothetical protein FZEAL_8684 [Fusarium zealandicum]
MLRGTTHAGPKVPLFGNRKERKQLKQQELKAQEEQLRLQALEEAEFATKAETFDFLTYYLQRSPYKDQSDQISIAWDSLPSLSELESYGTLNKTEGTHVCRRLFKAVVIWDDLGLDLWETLSRTLHQQQQLEDDDDDDEYELLDGIHEEPAGWDHVGTTQRRPSSRGSSRTSLSETFFSGRSRQTSADRQRDGSREPRRSSVTEHNASMRRPSTATSGKLPVRRPAAPHGMISEYYDSPSRYRLPKIVRVL